MKKEVKNLAVYGIERIQAIFFVLNLLALFITVALMYIDEPEIMFIGFIVWLFTLPLCLVAVVLWGFVIAPVIMWRRNKLNLKIKEPKSLGD